MGQGPLSGVKVLEFQGIGPGPFCGMLLSDLGADVVRIDRKGGRGGGALYLAFGILAGVISARATGNGQVVDCAMSDGAASLMAMFYGMKASGVWSDERRHNLLDGGAHFYDTYQCSDGRWISLGSIEPQFYALLLEKTGIKDPDFARQMDRSAWPALGQNL